MKEKNFTPSLWYNWADPKKCWAAGRMDKEADVSIKLINQSNPSRGVILKYRNGDVYDHGLGPEKEGNTEFTIECDPNQENTKPVVDGLPIPDGDTILYKFKMISKHACPK